MGRYKEFLREVKAYWKVHKPCGIYKKLDNIGYGTLVFMIMFMFTGLFFQSFELFLINYVVVVVGGVWYIKTWRYNPKHLKDFPKYRKVTT